MCSEGLNGKTILVTGVAGFIGSNLVKKIYQDHPDAKIIGIDNMNDYYDVRLKEYRLDEISKNESFVFIRGSIADKVVITNALENYKTQVVVNLTAQAGLTGKRLWVISSPALYKVTTSFWGVQIEKNTFQGDGGRKGPEE